MHQARLRFSVKGVDLRLLASLVIGVFMGAVDLTILAPALPRIGDSFGVTPSAVVLAFSLYAVFYAASVPLMSKLADVRGYKKVYSISMALFALGSAGAALSPSLIWLVAARALQGIGGGGLFPVAQAIVGVALPKHLRGQTLSILLGTFAAGGVLGPNLGGFLVQHANWHWIFWINVPLGLLGVILLAPISIPTVVRKHRIDWVGAILVALMFGSLVLGVEGLRALDQVGFFSPQIGGMFLLTLGGLAALVYIERKKPEPILDFRLIASAEIAPLISVSLLIGFALLSSVVFAPTYVQVQFGASVLGSGAVLNAAAVGLGLSSWIAGLYTSRTGGKLLVILGTASTALGIAIMILLSSSLWGILAGLVFLGAGLGLSQGPLSFMALGLAPAKDQGQVSGLISITRSMGGATGITIAGVTLGRASRLLGSRPEVDLSELDVQAWGSSSSLRALQEAPIEVQETVRQALGTGIINGWYWALGAAFLGLCVALMLRNTHATQDE